MSSRAGPTGNELGVWCFLVVVVWCVLLCTTPGGVVQVEPLGGGAPAAAAAIARVYVHGGGGWCLVFLVVWCFGGVF